MPAPSFSVEGWSFAFSAAVFGGIMICVALAGLSEYRKVFLANPREAMSLEVLLQLIFHPASTPALLSAFVLMIGLWFLAFGVLIFVSLLGIVLWEVTIRIWPKLLGHTPLFGSGTDIDRPGR